MKSKETPLKKSKTSKPAKQTKDIVAILDERFKHHVGVVEKRFKRHVGVLEERFKHYVGVILEDSNSKFQLIQEILETKATKEDFRTLHAEMQEMKSKQDIIEQVVKGHSGQLNEHTATLNEHTATLKEVVVKQDEHSTRLDRMETKLDQKADKEDLREIRNILSNHEQRLINLEN